MTASARRLVPLLAPEHRPIVNDTNAYVAAGLARLGFIQVPTYACMTPSGPGNTCPCSRTARQPPARLPYGPNRYLSAKAHVFIDSTIGLFEQHQRPRRASAFRRDVFPGSGRRIARRSRSMPKSWIPRFSKAVSVDSKYARDVPSGPLPIRMRRAMESTGWPPDVPLVASIGREVERPDRATLHAGADPACGAGTRQHLAPPQQPQFRLHFGGLNAEQQTVTGTAAVQRQHGAGLPGPGSCETRRAGANPARA
ncbi:MAG: transcriptional regulator, LysR family [Ramlibacter sp.]|nr:transcriptional regulator, LysR family [Ramlibacter sp.]